MIPQRRPNQNWCRNIFLLICSSVMISCVFTNTRMYGNNNDYKAKIRPFSFVCRAAYNKCNSSTF